MDLLDAHFVSLRLMKEFPDKDRVLVTLAVIQALRQNSEPQTLEQIRERVAKIIAEFGGGKND
jgi:hypothetical protein